MTIKRQTNPRTIGSVSDPRPPEEIARCRRETRRALEASGRCLVVLDDDPTGSQTVHDVPVYTHWSDADLDLALQAREPVVYLCTNTRSLARPAAAERARAAATGAQAAAGRANRPLLWASRSDSTLRGHYPAEVDAIAEGTGAGVDGVLVAPALFEAGRITADDVQWVRTGDTWLPAHETEFARDPSFGYRSAHLPEWIEERTRGRFATRDVRRVSLEMLRADRPGDVVRELKALRDGAPLVVNAAHYGDMDAFVAALLEAEADGKRFIYQCSASFLKARGGFEDRPNLDFRGCVHGSGGGLVVVGSYVGKTSRQLEVLRQTLGVEPVELRVGEALDPARRKQEVARVAEAIDARLRAGKSSVVCTSRERIEAEGDRFLRLGETIMAALCEAVGRLQTRPAWVLAKGGVTSMEVARTAFSAGRARVLGQALPGVPVWRLEEDSRYPGLAYVVFPGNVGGDHALASLVQTLEHARKSS